MSNKQKIFFILILVIIDFSLKKFFHGQFQNIFLNGDLYGYFPILGDIFGIKLVYNTGIAFSIPIEGIFLKILTTLIIIALIFYYQKYEAIKKNIIIDLSFIFIFAGAFSHFYERIFVGYVIDFLSLKNFAIFNFADILICVGGFILIIYSFLYERK